MTITEPTPLQLCRRAKGLTFDVPTFRSATFARASACAAVPLRLGRQTYFRGPSSTTRETQLSATVSPTVEESARTGPRIARLSDAVPDALPLRCRVVREYSLRPSSRIGRGVKCAASLPARSR